MSAKAQIAFAAASAAVLWIMVGTVLSYDYGIEKANPLLTAAQRRRHAQELAAIAAVFVVVNAVITVARILQIVRRAALERAVRPGAC